MNRTLQRGLALLLLPCLMADAAVAVTPLSTKRAQAPFTQQALIPRARYSGLIAGAAYLGLHSLFHGTQPPLGEGFFLIGMAAAGNKTELSLYRTKEALRKRAKKLRESPETNKDAALKQKLETIEGLRNLLFRITDIQRSGRVPPQIINTVSLHILEIEAITKRSLAGVLSEEDQLTVGQIDNELTVFEKGWGVGGAKPDALGGIEGKPPKLIKKEKGGKKLPGIIPFLVLVPAFTVLGSVALEAATRFPGTSAGASGLLLGAVVLSAVAGKWAVGSSIYSKDSGGGFIVEPGELAICRVTRGLSRLHKVLFINKTGEHTVDESEVTPVLRIAELSILARVPQHVIELAIKDKWPGWQPAFPRGGAQREDYYQWNQMDPIFSAYKRLFKGVKKTYAKRSVEKSLSGVEMSAKQLAEELNVSHTTVAERIYAYLRSRIQAEGLDETAKVYGVTTEGMARVKEHNKIIDRPNVRHLAPYKVYESGIRLRFSFLKNDLPSLRDAFELKKDKRRLQAAA